MVSRTAYAGTATTPSTHLASHDNSYAGGWLGYVEVTAAQTTMSSEVDLTGLSVAVTVGASRRIKLTGFVPAIEHATDEARFILRIKEGATTLAEVITIVGRIGASFASAVCMAVETPSTGSHTYKLTGNFDSAASTGTLNFSSTAVGFLLIEDVGPSS